MHSASRSLASIRPTPFTPHLQTRSLRSRARAIKTMASNFHSLSAKTLDGKDIAFDAYKGKVVLVTNVACYCGLTNSNYKELVELHKKYSDKGLVIQAWPCNQFGAQEPGTADQIKSFVADKFGGSELTFMEKVNVNGPSTHPVWKYLKSSCSTCDGDVTWNFKAKFLVDKDGNVVERNGDNPMAAEAKIQQLLAA